MKKLLLVLIAALAVSCSPQKRFTRLIDKHPYLVLSITDTLILSDTIYTDSIQFDTTWISLPIDTLILFDTLTESTVKIIRIHDTLTVSVTVPGDTIYIEKEVPVEILVDPPPCPRQTWLLAVGVIATLLILALLKWVILK